MPAAEKLEQDEWVRKQIELAGSCTVGYDWYRVSGGFRCKGGYHCVTDLSLAAGAGGYYSCSVWDNGGPRPPTARPRGEDELLVHKFLNNQCPPLSGDKETIQLDGWLWYGPRYKANNLRDIIELNERVEATLTMEQKNQVYLLRAKIGNDQWDAGFLADAQLHGYDIGNYRAGAGPRARTGAGARGGLVNYLGGNHQSPYYHRKW